MKVNIGPYPKRRKQVSGEYGWPKRKIMVKIDPWDTWGMDHTLALIIHPMLLQLKATKHGAPFTKDEDVPEHLRSTSPPVNDENQSTGDYEGAAAETNLFAKWEWILDEMIWAFEQELDEDAEDQFYTGEADHLWQALDKNDNPIGEPQSWERDGNKAPRGTKYWRMVEGPNHTLKHDAEGHQTFEARKANGFRLFGVYYSGLWD